ncbi:uncharacterized protein FIBRA_09534 [Fibroporia radiculosa]|uniref:Uncharacterized protein n=1 Tax=Fibroporia radiculosa TaxID=599839 RepID=J7SD54_9APHY|nr:uncharacterized protein FIBRA_09534 [Fibroporia radiculosa]CCM07193.1 predicted protein [Fibroporia radiculosa]
MPGLAAAGFEIEFVFTAAPSHSRAREQSDDDGEGLVVVPDEAEEALDVNVSLDEAEEDVLELVPLLVTALVDVAVEDVVPGCDPGATEVVVVDVPAEVADADMLVAVVNTVAVDVAFEVVAVLFPDPLVDGETLPDGGARSYEFSHLSYHFPST